MCWLRVISATLLFCLMSTAQNFVVPTNWRKPTSSLSRDARLSLVDAVLDTILPTFDETSGLLDGLTITQTASLLCALSTGDLISLSRTSRNAVIDSLTTVFTLSPNISSSYNSDVLFWGLAAMNSYRAYNDSSSLAFAESAWQQMGKFVITADQAASGTHPLRNTTISPECNGASIAGGVFFRPDISDDTEVNASTVAAYMELSARLFEATLDDQYYKVAELSATFVQNQLYSGGIILDTITVHDCLATNETLTYNSAFAIEGLSVLASKNASWTPFLNSLVSTVIRNTTWTNVADGINIEGPRSAADANSSNFFVALKGILIRALYETWSRSDPESAVANFIASYITVQFNALQDLASTPGINRYSPKWEGPPPTQFLPWGQLAALDVLNAAVGFATSSSSNSTVSVSPTAQSSISSGGVPTTTNVPHTSDDGKHKSPPIAAILGGIAAALVVIIVIIIAYVFFRRARRQHEEEHAHQPMNGTMDPYPPSSWISPSTLSSVPQASSPGMDERPSGGSPAAHRVPAKYSTEPLAPSANAFNPNTTILQSADATMPNPMVTHTAVHTEDQPHANPDTVPELIERLNRLISVLPPIGIEEQPPRYER